MRPKDTHQTRHNGGGSGTPPNTQFFTLFFFIMSKQVMISMLRQGNTGDEILQILNALTSDDVSEGDDNQPTLNTIDF